MSLICSFQPLDSAQILCIFLNSYTLIEEASMRRIQLCLVITIVATGFVSAQELTLDAAVDAALLDNPEVAAARERAAAATKRFDGGKSHQLPKIGLSESFV
jgi:hypothetical protein